VSKNGRQQGSNERQGGLGGGEGSEQPQVERGGENGGGVGADAAPQSQQVRKEPGKPGSFSIRLMENNMRVQGAVIREQGQTFAVVIVKPHVVQDSGIAADTMRSFMPVFGVPIVLMAQDGRGVPTYYGRRDLARFMSSVPLRAIPWKEYTIN